QFLQRRLWEREVEQVKNKGAMNGTLCLILLVSFCFGHGLCDCANAFDLLEESGVEELFREIGAVHGCVFILTCAVLSGSVGSQIIRAEFYAERQQRGNLFFLPSATSSAGSSQSSNFGQHRSGLGKIRFFVCGLLLCLATVMTCGRGLQGASEVLRTLLERESMLDIFQVFCVTFCILFLTIFFVRVCRRRSHRKEKMMNTQSAFADVDGITSDKEHQEEDRRARKGSDASRVTCADKNNVKVPAQRDPLGRELDLAATPDKKMSAAGNMRSRNYTASNREKRQLGSASGSSAALAQRSTTTQGNIKTPAATRFHTLPATVELLLFVGTG
ncbi:unnamed protein product, partial [Amoebophrya sp. A120]